MAIAVVALAFASAAPAAAAPGMGDDGWFDAYNRAIFALNAAVDRGLERLSSPEPASPEPGPAVEPRRRRKRGGFGNMMSNLVNEPVTVVASLAVADLPTAWTASRRFAINSTVGFLGWYDRASARGVAPAHADIGLALCRHGVGEGGYVILPLIGPRTVRDAVADVVLVNAILWTGLAAVLGTGASLQTILVAEAVEVAADIVATRQIDPHAKVLGAGEYAATRAEYLRQRRERCGIPVAEGERPAL